MSSVIAIQQAKTGENGQAKHVAELSAGPAPLPEAKLFELFPTPVLLHQWPEGPALAAQLRDVVFQRMRETPGVRITNVGGWHSEGDLQTWTQACVQELMGLVLRLTCEMVRRTTRNPAREHLEGWEIEGWANVNGYGASNRSHDHVGGNNVWSGIFYVDTGGVRSSSPEFGGLTKFEDRSGVPKEILANPDAFEREFTVVPEVGLMVLFPASLRHYVQTYYGQDRRVTIAFNLKHRGFRIPMYADQVQAQQWWWKNFRGLMAGLERTRQLARLGSRRNPRG